MLLTELEVWAAVVSYVDSELLVIVLISVEYWLSVIVRPLEVLAKITHQLPDEECRTRNNARFRGLKQRACGVGQIHC